MRRLRLSAVLIAGSLAAAPLAALGQGFTFDGIIAHDYVPNAFGGRQHATFADLGFRVAPGDIGPVGFEGGIFGYVANQPWGINRDAVGFASLTFALGGGQVQIGAPRSALYGLSDTPALGGAEAHTAVGGALTGVVPMSTFLSIFSGWQMRGLRYQHQVGSVSLAAMAGSYGSNGRIGSAAVVWQGTNARVYAGAERFSAVGGSNTHLQIGGSMRMQTRMGPVTVGASINRTDFLIPVRTASVFATAAVTDRLEVTAMLAHRTLGPGLRIGSISARYTLPGGLAVNLGAYRDQTASETTWSLGLQRRF